MYFRQNSRRQFFRTMALGASTMAAGTVVAPNVWGQEKRIPIKLASISSLSGNYARYGQELQRGAEIALEQVNAKGISLAGAKHHLELTTYDDKSDASTAAKLVEKAIASDRAHLVMAGIGSIIVKAIIPVAQRQRTPVLAQWATIDGVFAGQRDNPYVFGSVAPFSDMYTNICVLASRLEKPAIRSVAMITPNDELGIFTAKDYLPGSLKKAGLELAGVEFFPQKSQEYAAALERLRRLKPDMLIVNCYPPEAFAVFKELQTTRFFPPMLVVESPAKFVEAVGPDSTGVFVPSYWDPSLATSRDEYIGTSQNFAAVYKSKFNEDPPDFVAAVSAHNIVILAKALLAAGKTGDAAALNEALRHGQFETFFSAVKFDADGLNRRGTIYPAQFQNGALKLVYPPDVRTAEPIHPYPGYRP